MGWIILVSMFFWWILLVIFYFWLLCIFFYVEFWKFNCVLWWYFLWGSCLKSWKWLWIIFGNLDYRFLFYLVFLMKLFLFCRNFWLVERFVCLSEFFVGMEWFLFYYFFCFLVRIIIYLWNFLVFFLFWFIWFLKENELLKRVLGVDY